MLLSVSNRTNNKTFIMHFSLISISYFILLLSCGNNNTNATHLQVDSVFIGWNKATLSSLKDQFKSATDTTEKRFYMNRLSAFQAFIGIKEDKDVNISSIRYKFLKQLSLNNIDKRFCIIEAKSEGEVVVLRNYLINIDSKVVDVYNFSGNEWVKGQTRPMQVEMNSDLKNYLVKFGSGINQEDLIVTLFKDGTVNVSEYYLFTTLSKSNPWEKIFLLR